MALREEFERSGSWLFRHRGHLPLLLFVVVLLALFESEHSGGRETQTQDQLWEAFCLTLSLAGLAVRVAVVGYAPGGTSGRNTREQIAETLNTTGLYSVARHPLYLANFIMWLGVALLPRVWWCPVIVSFAFWLYYERIMFVEEEFLRRRFGEPWLTWAARTPAFIPALHGWRAPELPFCVRTVLKREYSALLGLAAVFTFLEIVGDAFEERRLEVDVVWAWIFLFAVVAYVVLRTLKRRTKLLHVKGR